MSSAPTDGSVSDPVHPQSDVSRSIAVFVESMLIPGHRLAADLKQHETMISRLENDLKNDPNNANFQAELGRKRETRHRVKSEIDTLTRELAAGLHLALKPVDSKSDTHAFEGLRRLENQMQQIQQKTDEARKEMVDVVNILKANNQKRVDEIADLRRNKEQQAAEIADLRRQIGDIEGLAPAHTYGTRGSTAPFTPTEDVQFLKNSLAQLADRVTELHHNFILTLSEDIPANLQEAVRIIQSSADAAAKSTIESSHRQLAGLIQGKYDELKSQISSIEEFVSMKTASSAVVLPTPSARLLEGRSQGVNQAQTPLPRDSQQRPGEQFSSSSISLPQSAPPDPEPECKQQ